MNYRNAPVTPFKHFLAMGLVMRFRAELLEWSVGNLPII